MASFQTPPRMLRILSGVFLLITTLVAIDVFGDFKGSGWSFHIALEIAMGILSAIAFTWLTYSHSQAKRNLADTQDRLSQAESQGKLLHAEAERWKRGSESLIRGLSQSIEAQFDQWKFSRAEKDIALLLIKGLSLKEIAEMRHTSERTVRTQSLAIYAKAGLGGRNELAAFFLEDLLAPPSP